MKNIFFLFSAAALFMSVFFYSSCKKKTNPLFPTPSNYRIQSYTKTTVNTAGITVTGNYSFLYDANDRVSQILFSSNDNTLKEYEHTTATFAYYSDTIVKTTTEVNGADTVEVDTFVTNSAGQIAYVFMPRAQFTFQYFGNLMAQETEEAQGDSGTTMQADAMQYTSNNSDFLIRSWDGKLTATWDYGGRNDSRFPPDIMFVPPFTVTWTSIQTATAAVTTHNNVSGYTDVLNNYSGGGPLEVSIVDANGTINRDTCIFPEDLSLSQAYNVYPSLFNRPGDYLWLESFTTYGINIYQQTHLVKNIENPADTTTCTYVLDADSKITQTSVVTKYVNANTLVNPLTQVYNIQYETTAQ